jgi:hypothetical protein
MSDYFNEATNGQVAIDIASSGDNTIISMFNFISSKYPTITPDVVDKRIFVTNYFLNAHDCVTVKWKSNTTDLSGPIKVTASGTMAANSANDPAIFWTGKNQDLILNLDVAVQVSGHVTFFIR